MVLVMIVIVLVMRLGPEAIDEYIAAIALFPAWRNPDRSAMGWEFPMPGNPLMAAVAIGPISLDPDVIAGWAVPFDDYFVAGRRRRPKVNVNVNRCDQARCKQPRATGGERRESTQRDQRGQAITENGFSGFYVGRDNSHRNVWTQKDRRGSGFQTK